MGTKERLFAEKRKAAPSTPASAEPTSPDAKRKPVATLRRDDCSASIWAREHVIKDVPTTFYSVTLERSYKDRDNKWKYVSSFDADNLGTVVSLCQEAAETIHDLQQKESAK